MQAFLIHFSSIQLKINALLLYEYYFMPRLTKRQKEAFGYQEGSEDPLAKQLLKLTPIFESVDRSNFQLGDEGQTYQEFMDMKGVQLSDTAECGRTDFSAMSHVSVGFIHKGRKKQYSEEFMDMISKFITFFFQLPVRKRDLGLKIGGQGLISKEFQYKIQKKQGMLDALQILDVLISIQKQKEVVVAFIDSQIHELDSSIYGRACGNGVLVIDISIKQNKQLLIETVIHETLHTFGFDHCLAWKCLMNPYVVNQLWLCPCCLRKILCETGMNLKQMAIKLRDLCDEYEFEASNKCKRIIRKIDQQNE